MKTIIIPDIHHRVYWIEDFLSLLVYDYVIFLGDYFDDFFDTLEDALKTAIWLKESLYKPGRIHLLGNHDLWYRFPYNKNLTTTGNTYEKESIIRAILNEDDWKLLRLYYYEQNYILSHAGIHINLINEYIANNIDTFDKDITDNIATFYIDKVIRPACEDALEDAKDGLKNSWLSAGIVRGGTQEVGGITWLDWVYEFQPISNLNQIVGHTLLESIGKKITKDSKNYCIDTNNEYIGMLENGEFKIAENPYEPYK